jgi:apolipoprotein N-acyltransferase
VENGMTIFRQTGQGVSVVVDAYGRVLNRADTYEESVNDFAGIQKVQTPIGSVNTLYPSIGDGVGNVMLLGLVGLLIGLWATRTRR